MAEKVRIEVEEGVALEGEFEPGPNLAKAAALILHPHPLYGGDMHNEVVAALGGAALAAGLSALRINFRGVGASGGRHGGGQAEVKDVAAAAKWLGQRTGGGLVLAGYSFGALVGSKAAPNLAGLEAGLWVAPPFSLGPMTPWPQDMGPLMLAAGDQDQYCPLEELRGFAAENGALGRLLLLEGGDHFFWGHLSALKQKSRDFMAGI